MNSKQIANEVAGRPDDWVILARVSDSEQRYMKSTKAMAVPGLGVLVQVTTEIHTGQRDNPDVAVAEALTFVPGATIGAEGSPEKGNLYRIMQAPDGKYTPPRVEKDKDQPEDGDGSAIGELVVADTSEKSVKGVAGTSGKSKKGTKSS